MKRFFLQKYSLEPEGDPLCVLLMIDYFAVRAGEYGFLLELFRTWEVKESSFACSLPMIKLGYYVAMCVCVHSYPLLEMPHFWKNIGFSFLLSYYWSFIRISGSPKSLSIAKLCILHSIGNIPFLQWGQPE